MALSTRHRATIYSKLTPILGEEEANALLAEFPASEHDELVTKEFLRAELAEVRAEIAHSANRTLIATSGMMIAGMGVAAAIGRALG